MKVRTNKYNQVSVIAVIQTDFGWKESAQPSSCQIWPLKLDEAIYLTSTKAIKLENTTIP